MPGLKQAMGEIAQMTYPGLSLEDALLKAWHMRLSEIEGLDKQVGSEDLDVGLIRAEATASGMVEAASTFNRTNMLIYLIQCAMRAVAKQKKQEVVHE